MRIARALVLAALLPLAALLVLPGGASAIELSSVAGPPFPSKSLLVTLPKRLVLTPDQVEVTENGEPVSDLTALPNSQAGTKFGTVLAIDASSSMHGDAIDSAVKAARTFAAQHDPRQPLGVVYFASQPTVALPLTTNRGTILSSLSTVPAVTPGTHLYDGVQQGIKMLSQAKVAAGAIIVLSDGTDTGSLATEASVVKAAEAAHLRIYSVGLQTRAFSRGTLSSLAAASGGSFLTASKSAVTGLYGRLGTELANQYLIRYRSTARLGSAVRVNVTVHGVGATRLDYFAPALPAAAGDPPVKDDFWTSNAAIAVIVGVCALLAGFAAYVLRAPRASLRSRVGEFVSLPSPDNERDWASTLVERALGDARRRERRGFLSWLAPSQEDLELAGVGMPRSQVLLATLGATAAMALVFVVLTGSPVGALLALTVPYVIRLALRVQLDRQRRLFDSQLPDNLGVIASAMRAGHTFLGALGVVVADAPEPSRREFRRVLADEQLGVPLSEGLDAVAERMGSRDFEHVALVATLQSETGGNTAEVIDQVNETIRERQDLRRLVRTLTAQGRLAGFVVSGLPVALMAIISVVNPHYIHPMFHRPAGIFMLVVAAIMLVAGASIIKRIVDIDV